jgi:hypothetical protein
MIYRIFRAAWILFLIALFAAPTSLKAQNASLTAKFYFYRYSMLQGVALRPAVYCDGREVIRMQSGRVFEMDVPSGEHSCYLGDKKSGAVVKAEPGKDYYFRVFIQPGVLKGYFRLDMMMPEQGRFDIQKLKPSEQPDTKGNQP